MPTLNAPRGVSALAPFATVYEFSFIENDEILFVGTYAPYKTALEHAIELMEACPNYEIRMVEVTRKEVISSIAPNALEHLKARLAEISVV